MWISIFQASVIDNAYWVFPTDNVVLKVLHEYKMSIILKLFFFLP